MVRWIRTATIKNGSKVQEALSWSKEISAYVEKTFGTGKVEVFLDAFGVVGKIRWMTDYPDLAKIDQVTAKMLGDQQYWKMVERATKSELFIEGSLHDLVMRSV
jgi:hypothetical protein